MLDYRFTVLDSLVTFDEGFELSSMASFHDQRVNLILEIPYGQPFIMKRSLLEILRNTIYKNGYRSSDLSDTSVWTFDEKGLNCLTCERKLEQIDDELDEENVEAAVDSVAYYKEKLDSLSKIPFRETAVTNQ